MYSIVHGEVMFKVQQQITPLSLGWCTFQLAVAAAGGGGGCDDADPDATGKTTWTFTDGSYTHLAAFAWGVGKVFMSWASLFIIIQGRPSETVTVWQRTRLSTAIRCLLGEEGEEEKEEEEEKQMQKAKIYNI